MAKKRRKKKGKRKVKKSGPRIPNPENATYDDIERECAAIQDMIHDIENHDVTESLTKESCYAIYDALTKISAMAELICQELEHAQEEPVYSLAKDQIKNLRDL